MRRFLRWGKYFALSVLGLIVLAILTISASVPVSYFTNPNLEVTVTDHGHYLLTNVKIVDVRSELIIENQGLVIEDGLIIAIDDLANLGQLGLPIIDGQDRFLMSGLADSHVHVFDPQDLGLYLSHGITSVRNMSGLPAHLRWSDALVNSEIMGPRMFTTSPPLNAGDFIGPFHTRVNSPEHARNLVNEYAEEGYDQIKVYSGLDLAMLEAVMDEANNLKIPVTGHPPSKGDFTDVLALPYISLEHIEELFQIPLDFEDDPELINQLTLNIAKSGQVISTTLVAYYNIYLASEENLAFKDRLDEDYLTSFVSFVGDRQLGDYWEPGDNEWETEKMRALKDITRRLFANGAKVAIGTDTGPALTMPGLSFHDEMALLEQIGISRKDILLAATENSSSLMNVDAINGRVMVGSVADLILVDENPLDKLSTLREPHAVIISGIHLDQQQLQSLRRQGKNHFGFYTVMGWLLAGMI